MVSLFALDRGTLVPVDDFGTTDEAVAETRDLWMEDDAPLLFVRGESGAILATLVRSGEDPEVCHTTRYDLGQSPTHEAHRCRYTLDRDGKWVSDVTPLGEVTRA